MAAASDDGDIGIVGDEISIDELPPGSHRPDEAPPDEASGEGNIDDDLLLRGLRLVPDGNQVAPAHPPDPSSDVEEEDARGDELAPVALVAADDEVGEAIGAAEEAELAVVLEPALGLLHGGLDGEGRGGVRCVLFEGRLQLLERLLLPLREGLGLLARGQPGDVGGGRRWRGGGGEEDRRQSHSGGEGLERRGNVLVFRGLRGRAGDGEPGFGVETGESRFGGE